MIRGVLISRASVQRQLDHMAAVPGRQDVVWHGIALSHDGLQGIAREGKLSVAGTGARLLQLPAQVSTKQATALILGHQWDGVDIGGRQVCRPMYGIVWGADKTISQLLAHEQLRPLVLEAMHEAVQKALAETERLLWTRAGKGGREAVPVRGVLALYSIHMTSGDGSPHLHVHIGLRATAPSVDGRWRTLDPRAVFGLWKRTLDGAIGRHLYQALQQRGIHVDEHVLVGSTWTPAIRSLTPHSERLSRRRQQVLEALATLADDPTWRQNLVAWRITRRDVALEAVEHGLDRMLRDPEQARRVAAVWGIPEGEIEKALGRTLPEAPPLKKALFRYAEAVRMRDAQVRLQTARQIFGELQGHIRRWCVGDITAALAYHTDAASATALTYWLLRDWQHLGLIQTRQSLSAAVFSRLLKGEITSTTELRAVFGPHAYVVTTRQLEEEQALYEKALGLARARRQPILTNAPAHFTPEQRAALDVLRRGRALSVVQGVAGAGKTTLLHPLVEAAQQQGLRVQVLARNAIIARELGEELGVPSSTLETATRQGLRPRQPTLLIVDEGGVVDLHHMQALLEAASQPHVQLVLLGDRQQTQPIDQRAAFAIVAAAAARAGQLRQLRTSFRTQAWQAEHEALRRALSPQHAQKAVAMAGADGRIYGSTDLTTAIRQAVDWWQALSRRESTVILSPTNELAAAAATEAQSRLGITIDPRTRLRWGQRCGIGDIVRIRFNRHDLGLLNGTTARVVDIDQDGITIEHRGRRLYLDHGWTAEHVELAYALTIDSAQGLTVDRAIVLATETGHSRLYTAATRGRQAPVWVVVHDEEETPEQALERRLQRDDIARTGHELVGQRIVKSAPSHEKERLLAILQRLEEHDLIHPDLARFYRARILNEATRPRAKHFIELHVQLVQQAQGRRDVLRLVRTARYEEAQRLLERGRNRDDGLEL